MVNPVTGALILGMQGQLPSTAVVVVASDDGSPQLSASITVTITTATDPPVFSELPYNASVHEDKPIFSSVLRVQATGGGSSVEYQILEGNTDVSVCIEAIE